MSKKDKLKKEKEKQLNMKKLADLEELEEKEAAKHKESRGAKKMRRRAKRGYIGVWQMLLKLLMTAAFLWSGFFHGGVLAAAVLGENIYIAKDKTMPHWVAYCALAGAAVVFVAIILAFVKKYIASFIGVLAGSAVYMHGVRYMMKTLKTMIDTQYVAPDQQNMYRDYMIRYYPMMLTLLFSLILLVISIVITIRRKRREKAERDNAPVESIIGGE